MKMNILKAGLAFVLTTMLFVRCGSSSMLGAASPLMSALGGAPNLSTMSKVLQTPGLNEILGGALKNKFTLLAPTNDAFSKLGGDALTNLAKPENLEKLGGILKNHVVPGKLDAKGIMQNGLKTAGGKGLDLGGVNIGNIIGGDKFNILPIDKVLN